MAAAAAAVSSSHSWRREAIRELAFDRVSDRSGDAGNLEGLRTSSHARVLTALGMRWKAGSVHVFVVAVAVLTLCSVCLAQASRVANLGGNQRVALVIGNEKYVNQPLPNATGDARAVAQRLRELGFSVREHHNLGKARMEEEYRSYTLALQESGGLGFLYYSGHGAQFGGQTYLVPVDAEMTDPRAAAFWAVALEPMVAVFERLANRGNIVILDACRTNEFGREASRSPGLAAVSLAAVRNTLIEYATSPGQVAADGPPGAHSAYTEALLQHMSAPNVEVGDMFRRVRQSVEVATRNKQSPWSAGGLRTRVVLADQEKSISAVAPPATGFQARRWGP